MRCRTSPAPASATSRRASDRRQKAAEQQAREQTAAAIRGRTTTGLALKVRQRKREAAEVFESRGEPEPPVGEKQQRSVTTAITAPAAAQ